MQMSLCEIGSSRKLSHPWPDATRTHSTRPSEADSEVRSPGRRVPYMMRRKPGTSRENAGKTREGLDHNPYVVIVGCSRSGTTLLQDRGDRLLERWSV